MKVKTNKLEEVIKKAQDNKKDVALSATIWQNEVLKAMKELRTVVDIVETKVASSYWPMPTYMDLLFKN